jgi:hypothetical protein
VGATQYQSITVLYPGWGISPKGAGFVVSQQYRTHTVLTMLASIGGLWTILSFVFSAWFGRSILFPIVGKNLLYFFHLPFIQVRLF